MCYRDSDWMKPFLIIDASHPTYIGIGNIITRENLWNLLSEHITWQWECDLQSNVQHWCLGKRLKKDWRECSAHDLHYLTCNARGARTHNPTSSASLPFYECLWGDAKPMHQTSFLSNCCHIWHSYCNVEPSGVAEVKPTTNRLMPEDTHFKSFNPHFCQNDHDCSGKRCLHVYLHYSLSTYGGKISIFSQNVFIFF